MNLNITATVQAMPDGAFQVLITTTMPDEEKAKAMAEIIMAMVNKSFFDFAKREGLNAATIRRTA